MAKKSCCSCKVCCAVCCSISCVLIIAIGVWVAIIASAFEQPDVNVKEVNPVGFELTTSEITMTYDIVMNVSNPNDWPIEGSIESLTANVHSLDKDASDSVGEALHMTTAYLPKEVDIKANSDSIFSIFVEASIKASGSDAQLFARITRDCGVLGDQTTKIRVTLSGIKASALGISIDMEGMDVPIEMLMSCEGSTSGVTETITTTTTPSVMSVLP